MASINTNAAANFAFRNLSISGLNLEKSIQKLSSGFRINRSADDAAGAAIANDLRATGRSLQAAQRSASQANAVLNIADGAVNTVASILDRLKELATSAASDSSGATGRANLDAEYQQLVLEIDRISATTKYQGTNLVDGTYAGKFIVSSSGAYGTDDTVTVAGASIDLKSASLLGGAAANVLTAAAAVTELGKIDVAIGKAGVAIGAIGSAQSRIEFASANVASTLQNVIAAESVIRDADIAFETTQFTKNQILQQAGTAMLAQANQAPQGILQLLR